MIKTVAQPDPPEVEPRQPDGAAGLGSRLRNIYDDVANEPLPDAFEELLRKLQ